MHLILNLGDLLIPLWRGTLKCDDDDNKELWEWVRFVDEVWKPHGVDIAETTPYFPSSFHRPPRNPAEKINSGYKATEFYLYIFGLGPGFFRPILQKPEYQNYCRLVEAFKIVIQRKITGAQIKQAKTLVVQFIEEYEDLYYQRIRSRFHFCRPCIHTLLHIPEETIRVAPGCLTSQYLMERVIGYLGDQIKQPSNPFANLAARTYRQAQINSLKAICPELAPRRPKATGNSHHLPSGHVFMIPCARTTHSIPGAEGLAIERHFGEPTKVRRWGRLLLPNGQIARSHWRENLRKTNKIRVSRMVKVKTHLQLN